MDITEEWLKTQGEKGAVIERKEYTIGDTTYKVDGHHVILETSTAERTIANILASRYGKTVELVPKINYPDGKQTPDYLIDGVRYDLKSPTGVGKYLLKGLIAKKRKQADNFIIDITECTLSIDEIERQINELYKSPQVGFVINIVVLKNGEVVKVFCRKQKRNRP